MGFDKQVHADHCYSDDPADGVAMNVEIIEENPQVAQNNVITEKPTIRYIDISGNQHTIFLNDTFEDANNCTKKALIYLPYSEYCTDHAGLFLHEDEKLVKPGDKFASHNDFVQYLNENAKRWCFYYRCSDSRKPNTEYETYTYNCVYLRNKEKYKKKGMRKRYNSMKTDCPCKIKLRHLPNEKELTVVYVCNHHDHELSLDDFYKLQHGRRLPPYVKEEIKDFLQLKVDVMKIRAYVEMETGFNMSRPFFYAVEKNMKNRNVVRHISEKRLAMLKQKLAAVERVYGCKDEEDGNEQAQSNAQHHLVEELAMDVKPRRSLMNPEKVRGTPMKIRSKSNGEVTSSDVTKRRKREQNTYSIETLQSVKHLQESIKCEIQRNPWVSDQCVPVLPNRTVKKDPKKSTHVKKVENKKVDALDEASHLLNTNDIENLSYTIEYYDPDESNNDEISQELGKIMNEGKVTEIDENAIENIAYETVVTEDVNETQVEEKKYDNQDEEMDEGTEISQETEMNDTSDILNEDFESTQDTVEEENQEDFLTEDNDTIVQYIDAANEQIIAQDVGVQTVDEEGSAHSLLPVFDVYMKDGNVTGFVVNDSAVSGAKECVDKEIQTTEDLILSDLQDIENDVFEGEIIHDTSNSKMGDTYTKHEYVHKYNIDKYMVQPHFPKYVETLAKETFMDVLQMFTNIYNEKAMFKITTTQRGKEGNTRIWYVTDGPRFKKRRKEEPYSDRLGKNLQSIILLKDKLKTMRKRNKELIASNKQLEEVALKLLDMTEPTDNAINHV